MIPGSSRAAKAARRTHVTGRIVGRWPANAWRLAEAKPNLSIPRFGSEKKVYRATKADDLFFEKNGVSRRNAPPSVRRHQVGA